MTTTEHVAFTPDIAETILRKACAVVGLEPDGVELLRVGDHAVYRVAAGEVVARVGRNPDRLPSVRREVSVAQWLADSGCPAVRLATDAEQPVVVDGHPVTFWEGLADGETYASTGEMGGLLRQLHSLAPPPVSLPPLRPFEKVEQRLQRAVIPPATRSFLSGLEQRLAEEYERLEFVLPGGHVHGDFNVGNVLQDAEGHAKVIDLDGFVSGPREWDLMQTAMYYDSFGWHTEAEYADFMAGYGGFDVREWSGYDVLRSVRELLMVTWLAQNAGTDQRSAEEVEKRVETLRTGGARCDWAPF